MNFASVIACRASPMHCTFDLTWTRNFSLRQWFASVIRSTTALASSVQEWNLRVNLDESRLVPRDVERLRIDCFPDGGLDPFDAAGVSHHFSTYGKERQGVLSNVRLTVEDQDGRGPIRTWLEGHNECYPFPSGPSVGNLTRGCTRDGFRGKKLYAFALASAMGRAVELGLDAVVAVATDDEPWRYLVSRLGFARISEVPLTLEARQGVLLQVHAYLCELRRGMRRQFEGELRRLRRRSAVKGILLM